MAFVFVNSCLEDELLLETNKPDLPVENRVNISDNILDFSFLPVGKSMIDTIYIKNNLDYDLKLFGYKAPKGIIVLDTIDKESIKQNDSIAIKIKITPHENKPYYSGDSVIFENNFNIPLIVKIKSNNTYVDSLCKINIDEINLSSCYLGEKKEDSISITNNYGFDIELNSFVAPNGFKTHLDTLKIQAFSKAKLPVCFIPIVKKAYKDTLRFKSEFGANLKTAISGVGTENLFMYVNNTKSNQIINIGSINNEIVYQIKGKEARKEHLIPTKYNNNQIANMNELAISVLKGDTLLVYRSEEISSISNLCYDEDDTIPEDLFYSCRNIKNLNYVFSNSSVQQIPENIFSELINLESIEYGFKDCKNLLGLPNNIFENNTNIRSLKGCFSGINLKSVSDNIIASNWNDALISNGEIFTDLFKGSEVFEIKSNANSILEINQLIQKNPYFKNFCSSTSYCRIFLNNNLYFYNNTNWSESIVFSYINTTHSNQIINIGTDEDGVPYLIRNKELNRGVLRKSIIDNQGTIFNLENLAVFLNKGDTILVNNADKLTSISNLKYASTEQIPSDLFENCENILSFYSVFKGSENNSIPKELFENNKKVLSFESAFEECNNLTEIPQRLFKNNADVKNFQNSFKNSTITKIYDNIFPATWTEQDVTDDDLFNGFLEGTNLEEIIVTVNTVENINPILSINKYFKELCSENKFVKLNGKEYKLVQNNWIELMPFVYSNNTESEVTVYIGALDQGTTYSVNGEEGNVNIANIENNIVTNKEELAISVGVGQQLIILNSFSISYISNLKFNKQIPEGILDVCVNLKNVESIFEGCTNLETVPNNLFQNNKEIRNFSKAFKNTSVKSISDQMFPSDWSQTRIEEIDFTEMFIPLQLYYINSSSSDISGVNNVIKEGSFFRELALHKSILTLGDNYYRWDGNNWLLKTGFEFVNREGADHAIAMSLYFDQEEKYYINGVETGDINKVNFPVGISPNESSLSSLTITVPINASFYVEDATKIRAISYLRTTNIPKDFLKNCTKLECVSGLFMNSQIKKIPEDIFKGLSTIKTFSACFKNCSNLEEVPIELFKDCTSALNFEWLFEECSNLQIIPADLFAYSNSIITLEKVFKKCSKLSIIPNGLFDNCTKVVNFSQIFSYCMEIKSLPPDLFSSCKKAQNLSNAFENCIKLTDITGVFSGCNLVANFEETFKGCSSLKIVDRAFEGCSLVTNFTNVFTNCNLLESAVETFSGCTQVESFNGMFKDKSNLKDVTGVFKNCTSATSFYITFRACVALKDIEEAFNGCSNAIDFNNAFASSGIEVVPNNLFKGCTNVKKFYYTFYNCKKLKTIGSNVFKDCVLVETFNSTFSYCEVLETIPQDLFKDCVLVEKFNSTFSYCEVLETIPQDLFKYNVKVIDFIYVFSNCTNLISIPETLFKECVLAENFSYSFYECEVLETIPPNLFKYNIKAINFGCVFSYCIKLSSIPETLFKECVLAESFAAAFLFCEKLTSIPNNLFKDMVHITNFLSVFSSCKNLETIGNDVFKGCYSVIKAGASFASCTKLSSIPENLFKDCANLQDVYRLFIDCTSLTSLSTTIFPDEWTVISGDIKNKVGEIVDTDDLVNNPITINYNPGDANLSGLTPIIKNSSYFRNKLNGTNGKIESKVPGQNPVYWKWNGSAWVQFTP